ncbi:MAG: hypothetical protein F6K22_07490 [Okeania sp. SIO2F4]|uniref:hypothetical protein n=1 Tax=Okeania sp. SIO2F4 TaxID=2607790 RepID=UPI00142AA3C2|nr:hypothetical protein [Okeania sp. SIO2F4]NES02702.1 hypothetical protein [Okeania sp. SIO2F4]
MLIAITPESTLAFTINQKTKVKNLSDYSFFYDKSRKLGGIGVTTLGASDPLTPWSPKNFSPFLTPIKRGGTAGLLEDLKPYMNEGWTFTKGRNLKGSFNVTNNYACGRRKICYGKGLPQRNLIRNNAGGVGAVLEFFYRPGQRGKKVKTADPKPRDIKFPSLKAPNLYWIQRVITNFPATTERVGQRTTYIDNINPSTKKNDIHPYLGSNPFNMGNNGYFGDRPYRKKYLKKDFYSIAELYLAKADIKNPQKVTIYNGVRWGWKYKYYSIDDLRKSCLVTKRGRVINVSSGGFWGSLQKTGKLSTSLINGICQKQTPKPKPKRPKPPKPSCSGGSGGGGCRSRSSSATDYIENNDQSYADILEQMESQEYLDSSDRDNTSNTTLQTVPEPTSAFALLMLGVGAIATLKNRNNKPK